MIFFSFTEKQKSIVVVSRISFVVGKVPMPVYVVWRVYMGIYYIPLGS